MNYSHSYEQDNFVKCMGAIEVVEGQGARVTAPHFLRETLGPLSMIERRPFLLSKKRLYSRSYKVNGVEKGPPGVSMVLAYCP